MMTTDSVSSNKKRSNEILETGNSMPSSSKKRKSDSKKKASAPYIVGSDSWIMNQNPFFLSALQKERRQSIIRERNASSSHQSAIEKLREHESKQKKQDMEMQKAFKRSANPFFAQVGRAIRNQTKRNVVDLISPPSTPRGLRGAFGANAESSSKDVGKWLLPSFPSSDIAMRAAEICAGGTGVNETTRAQPCLRASLCMLNSPCKNSNMFVSVPKITSESLSRLLVPNVSEVDKDDPVVVSIDRNESDSSGVETVVSLVSAIRTMREELFTTSDGRAVFPFSSDVSIGGSHDDNAEARAISMRQEARRLYFVAEGAHKITPASSSIVWREKYRPTTPKDIVGSDAASAAGKLCEWLKLWRKRFTAERKSEKRALRRKLRQYACFDNVDHEYIDAQLNESVSTGFCLEGMLGSGKTSVVC
eukprot:g2979.t1